MHRALAVYVRLPRGYDHGQRLQDWSTAVFFCLQAVHGCRYSAHHKFLFFFALARCGRHCAITIFQFFVLLECALESDTVPTGRCVGNFAAFCAYFTIGESVSSSSSAQACLVREDAVTDCVPFLEVSIFPCSSPYGPLASQHYLVQVDR